MKKIVNVLMVVLVFILTPCTAFAIGFCKDIAPTNPPEKTFDDEWTIIGLPETIAVDIWINDLPESLISAGFWLNYDPSMVSVSSVNVYDGLNAPWDPGFTVITEDAGGGPGTYMVHVRNFATVPPDIGGDIIIARVEFHCIDVGDANIEVTTIPGGDSIVGQSNTTYGGFSNVITLHQIPIDGDNDGIPYGEDNCPDVFNPDQVDTDGDCIGDVCDEFPDIYDETQPDSDTDGIGDVCDNCPLIPNSPDLGICRRGNAGSSCMSDEDCGIEGDCYLEQEESACTCVSNFDCDYDVDGSDAANFKMHFGRSSYINPCTNESLCKGDFDCDCDVDGSDSAKFKRDFGRVNFCSADYSASCSMACLSCVDDVYAYTCSYEE